MDMILLINELPFCFFQGLERGERYLPLLNYCIVTLILCYTLVYVQVLLIVYLLIIICKVNGT